MTKDKISFDKLQPNSDAIQNLGAFVDYAVEHRGEADPHTRTDIGSLAMDYADSRRNNVQLRQDLHQEKQAHKETKQTFNARISKMVADLDDMEHRLSIAQQDGVELTHENQQLKQTVTEMKVELEILYEERNKLLSDLHEAYHDNITGLMNRALFFKEVESKPEGRYLFGYMDLRGLKAVNDDPNLGHESGDIFLQAAAETLRSIFPDAIIARAGGDEFWFMVPLGENEDIEEKKELVQDVFAGKGRGVVIHLKNNTPANLSARFGFQETGVANIKNAIENADAELAEVTNLEKTNPRLNRSSGESIGLGGTETEARAKFDA